MSQRHLCSDNIAFLKTASRRLIASCGGVESGASVTRVNKTALSDYQNPDKPEYFMPIDVAAELERDCGTAHMAQAMARLSGGYFVKPAKFACAASLADALPRIGAEAGQVLGRAGKALADGKIKDKEKRELKKELEESIAAHLAAIETLGD